MRIPSAPSSIQKGVPLKELLNLAAIECLAENISAVCSEFKSFEFIDEAGSGLEPLGIFDRAKQIADSLKIHLPSKYSSALKILLETLTPPLTQTTDLGLAGMFYLPHVFFIEKYGLSKEFNEGEDPFEVSMKAQLKLTQRFTSEFCIRPFLIAEEERTLAQLKKWISHPSPHVRRLCSEGTRSRLPWAPRIPSFIKDPNPVLFILEALKNDEDLYVRRSVANHLGDIAKDHLELVFEICERWLKESNNELKWVIRHALRHPAKKGNTKAVEIRLAAKAVRG
jgi:3-methyladenine DNA glycosylase AlkC